MATIRESLKKLTEVAQPVPGDEKEFKDMHVIKSFDPQGNDAIHSESPYGLIQKNVAAVKSPSERAEKPNENHGYNKSGESEAAYHVPESREQKVAKLSMMMEATLIPSEQQLAEALKTVLADTFNLYLKAHHFHWNVMGPDFAQYHEFFGEFYEEVHGAVDMIAENIRILGELAPGNLGMPGVDNLTSPQVMVNTLLADNRKVIGDLKVAYSLAEASDRLGIANFLQDRLGAHEKHEWMMQAISGIKGETSDVQEAKQSIAGVKMHYHNPKTGEKFHEIHFAVPTAEKFRKQHEKAGFKLVKKEAHMAEEALKGKVKPFVSKSGIKEYLPIKGKIMPPKKIGVKEEMEPLLPKQKKVAAAILDKELEDKKKQQNANRQAGTMSRMTTIRPSVELARNRHQSVKKQIVDKT